jgi:hypothetical protein
MQTLSTNEVRRPVAPSPPETSMEDDKSELLKAVHTLISSPHAHALFDQLSDVLGIASRVPLLLRGDAAVLNSLLKLKLHNPGTYEKVIELIETKRAALGYDRLIQIPNKAGYDKTSYMREFMDQKRMRQRRAAEIENMRRPERDRLMGIARLEFMRRTSQRWKDLRDLALEQGRQDAGGSLTAAQRAKIIDTFWHAVDADLDVKYEAAKRDSLLNAPRKREVSVDDLTTLIEALRLPAR